MSLARGAAISFGCATLGAVAWAAVSLATDMRLGLIGIVVGGLAGFGMGMGTRARGGVGPGLAAAAVALVTIFASRAIVANITASRMVAEHTVTAEEYAQHALAMEVAETMADDGVEFSETEDSFPPEVTARADREWNAMTAEERDERTQAAAEMQETGAAVAAGALTVVAFLVDLGLFGFVFVGLAMATAYKIGATAGEKAAGVDSAGLAVEHHAESVAVEPASPALRGFPMAKPDDDEDPLERLKRLRAKHAAATAATDPETATPPTHQAA